jgi:hypothetical protein
MEPIKMTEEEKLEKAKELYKTANADQRYVLECLFYELKESEDEIMRKAIKKHFEMDSHLSYSGIDKKDILAWLEKLGEYILANSVKSCKDEQKPVENKGMNWTEMNPFQKKVFCIVDTAIEEEQGLSNICNELLALAKQEIEQNQWSERDKEEFQIAIDTLAEAGQRDSAHWLKFLKERYTWKPSDEQINALAENIEYVSVGCTQPILKGLLEDLKKLRKE